MSAELERDEPRVRPWLDNNNYSKRADVLVLGSKVEGAHKRMAKCREDFDRWQKAGRELCARYVGCRNDLEDIGVEA
jgi:hypothetical protein